MSKTDMHPFTKISYWKESGRQCSMTHALHTLDVRCSRALRLSPHFVDKAICSVFSNDLFLFPCIQWAPQGHSVRPAWCHFGLKVWTSKHLLTKYRKEGPSTRLCRKTLECSRQKRQEETWLWASNKVFHGGHQGITKTQSKKMGKHYLLVWGKANLSKSPLLEGVGRMCSGRSHQTGIK